MSKCQKLQWVSKVQTTCMILFRIVEQNIVYNLKLIFMRSISFTSYILIVLLIFVQSCAGTQKRYDEAKRAALASGIRVDTIMFGICFNDSPEIVDEKLKNTGMFEYGNLHYRFRDSRISGMTWKDIRAFWFYNDSLISFKICSFDDSFNWKEVVKEVYSAKYGEPVFCNGKHYWFKGNLEICVSEGESILGKKQKLIEYFNVEAVKKVYSIRELRFGDVNDMNYYSPDYWEKHIKPKEEKEMQRITRDI